MKIRQEIVSQNGGVFKQQDAIDKHCKGIEVKKLCCQCFEDSTMIELLQDNNTL